MGSVESMGTGVPRAAERLWAKKRARAREANLSERPGAVAGCVLAAGALVSLVGKRHPVEHRHTVAQPTSSLISTATASTDTSDIGVGANRLQSSKRSACKGTKDTRLMHRRREPACKYGIVAGAAVTGREPASSSPSRHPHFAPDANSQSMIMHTVRGKYAMYPSHLWRHSSIHPPPRRTCPSSSAAVPRTRTNKVSTISSRGLRALPTLTFFVTASSPSPGSSNFMLRSWL